MRISQRDWLVAIALAAMFSFTGLANHPLQANDEPRVAGIGWEMQHTGQWWLPHLAGEPFLEQPPLFYALQGVAIERFGASPGVARLPGAVASALTLLLVFALARRVANPAAGLAALLALVGIGGFFRYSHRGVVDPLLTLFVMSGYYAYVRAVWGSAPNDSPSSDARVSPVWLVAVYLAAALAFWVKGLVGVVAVGGPLAVDVLVNRRWRALASPAHLVGLPLLLAACAAWPLVLHAAEGEAAARGFLLQNGLYRIAPGAGAGQYFGGHEEPFWYYLPRIPGQLGWIALFVPAAAAWLLRGGAPPEWRLPALRFLACVFPVGVLLLSIPGTKRGLYVLPFEPPLAVAIGAWIAAAALGDAHRSPVERAVNTACAHVVGVLLRPIAKQGGVAELREDITRAATGPCRAPQRLAAAAFAIAVAWNLFAYPFKGEDRDLGPMAREVGERAGAEPLLGLSLEECVRGALPFYAGLVPIRADDATGLAQRVARSGARHLLAPVFLQDRIEAELGHPVSPELTWNAVGTDYALYPLPPPAARAAGPLE